MEHLKLSKIVKKICILGIEGVGKTSLIRRFVDDQFDDSYLTTIGAKISKKNISLSSESEVELIIWDIEGVKVGEGVIESYFIGASCFIIVGDMSRKGSLASLVTIFRENLKDFHEKSLFVFALNKSDLVNLEDGFKYKEVLTQELGVGSSVFLTSAKVGRGVEELFVDVAEGLIDECSK